MSKARIVVVEDEGITALNIKGLLENWGYENPLIVLSSIDIFQKIAQYQPDLILMDIDLDEDVDGIEIAEQLQTDFDIPVIYLTAHSDGALVERAKVTEHYGYIIKPFNDEELKINIDHALYKHKMERKLKETNKCLEIELEKKKIIEKKLKKSEKKFRSIVEQSYDGISLIDENGSIVEWNRGMEKITGVKGEYILGKTMGDMLDDLDVEEKSHKSYNHLKNNVMEFVGSKNHNLSGKLFEGTVTNVDGSKKAVQIRHFPIKTNNKRIVAGIVRDVTEQKRMEEELKTAKNNLELKVKERTQELITSNEELEKEISNRKNAEKALTKSRNFLDIIINSIADPVSVKDKNHQWVLLNDAFCNLMGYPQKELLGKSYCDFLPAHEASIFWDKDKEVFKTGIENVNEAEVTDSEGNLHILVTKKTLYGDNSGESYLVAVSRDITELKKAENAIRESESYYKTIFENTGAATFIIEEDTTVSLVNAEFEKISGYSKEEIEGKKSWMEFVSADYLKKIEEYHDLRRLILL